MHKLKFPTPKNLFLWAIDTFPTLTFDGIGSKSRELTVNDVEIALAFTSGLDVTERVTRTSPTSSKIFATAQHLISRELRLCLPGEIGHGAVIASLAGRCEYRRMSQFKNLLRFGVSWSSLMVYDPSNPVKAARAHRYFKPLAELWMPHPTGLPTP